MNNMIIGTPEGRELRKHMDKLDAQVSALLDGMRAMEEALTSLANTVDQLEGRLSNVAIDVMRLTGEAGAGGDPNIGQNIVEFSRDG